MGLSYLRIKQPICVPDISLATIQSIVGSRWSMEVYVRHARPQKYSHETAPNQTVLHGLFNWQKIELRGLEIVS